MAFLQPSEQVGEPTFIYDHSRTYRNMPAWTRTGIQLPAGMEPLSTSENYDPFSMAPTVGPGLNYFGFGSNVSEYPGPSHSRCEIIPDLLDLCQETGEPGFHLEREDTFTAELSLLDPGESSFQVSGGESMGSLQSGVGLTGSEAHPE
jgi:hypothetical protein